MINIHPAFVHFPIALLILYAIIELFPLYRWMPGVAWASMRGVLLYVGTASAILAAITGLMAAEIVGELPAVEVHEKAALALVVLAILTSAVNYFWRNESPASRYTLKALALAIFLMLFIVGALGASIVYGPEVDPIVSFVTGLFGLR